MTTTEPIHCPDHSIANVVETLRNDDEAGLVELSALARDYPGDARLKFLEGSVLAGLQRYGEARDAMQAAITLAPNYDLARFQLGFLELTSGLPNEATETWAPFGRRPENDPFHLLAAGLNCLARDDYAQCDELLRRGMTANTDNPLINNDMQLILDEIQDKLGQPAEERAEDHEAASPDPATATDLLLQQFALKDSINKTHH